ncbi:MAG: pyridoxal phosphate-dependent aminotransferase family protein [Candidatus Taylorbacteria bacterium]|nr:pyridoxal phosphate-dependent aminotransferase family protein [Candidatus Taylorbacteria bacterium]
MKPIYKYFSDYVALLREKELYPTIYTVDGPSVNPTVSIGGATYLSFSSNNYLGLATNPEAKAAIKAAVDKYGVGSGSTRLLSGTLDIQLQFEKELAEFFGAQRSITFSSGYMANIGVIRMLVDPFPYFHSFFDSGGLIISDELNHASIIDGVRLAKSPREVYDHSDMRSLEKILKKNKRARKLIITDGVFSMDGDIAKLPEIAELADQYNSIIMVDDSHGIGVLGRHGEGTAGELGVANNVDVIMGSFTKAFGSLGGFVTVNETLSDYLRITARSYIFSDPIPPCLVAGLMVKLRLIKAGNNLRHSVISSADRLRSGLRKCGFEVLGEKTSIVPLLIGNEDKAIAFSAELAKRKILAPCIRRPAVNPGRERLRFSVMACHSAADIDRALDACREIGKALQLI